MSKQKFPVTAATRYLREHQIEFAGHLYRYEERGGTAHSAACLAVSYTHLDVYKRQSSPCSSIRT